MQTGAAKQTGAPKMHTAFSKFESSDSVVFLDQRIGRGSSVSASAHGKPLTEEDDGSELDMAVRPAAPLTVAVSIQHRRVMLFTILILAIIVGLDLIFKHGVEIDRFESRTKNATDRVEMLNDANSLSGYISTAFGKPIELFVTILTQIITLRFMAHTFTQANTSWKLMYVKIALSAGIGYMIGNGFNAANVQLREADVHAVIMASDLFVPSDLNDTAVSRTTTASNTVSENTASNLISNTALRNAILPRVTFKETICDWKETQQEDARGGEVPLPTVTYGFTQRDWQSRILQEALSVNTLRMTVNPTNKTANSGVDANKLPMNASMAADLFLYMMNVAPNVFPWGKYGDFVDMADFAKRYPATTAADKKANFVQRTPVVTGLLPDSDDESEEEQREWFLKAAATAVARQFTNATNTSRSDITAAFSHVNITSTIDFDAITFEVDIDPKLLATATGSDNATRYTEVIQAGAGEMLSDCGPWPALCLVKKPAYQPKPNAYVFDPLQQVYAFGSCTTDVGDELRTFSFGDIRFTCNESSNSSIMIVSIGKRLVADSITQNKSDNVTNREGAPALIKNLRKIYSITIGRISWRLENLAQVFGASCGTDNSSHTCMGLQLPLSTSSLSAYGLVADTEIKNQRLVVSVEAIPTDLIVASTRLSEFKPRSVALVDVSEPPFDTTLGGDILMPHNIGQIEWKNQTVTDKCDADIEGLLHSKLNNHIYIEYGLQTAYTAATFFLLQDAVVKDMIVVTASDKSMTLKFDGNTQDIIVWVSTPSQNALLTLAGCATLLLILIVALGQTAFCVPKEKDPLAAITAPQAIARVMLDDEQFPSLLLNRQIVDHQGQKPQPRDLEKFSISQLAVAHEGEEEEKDTVGQAA